MDKVLGGWLWALALAAAKHNNNAPAIVKCQARHGDDFTVFMGMCWLVDCLSANGGLRFSRSLENPLLVVASVARPLIHRRGHDQLRAGHFDHLSTLNSLNCVVTARGRRDDPFLIAAAIVVIKFNRGAVGGGLAGHVQDASALHSGDFILSAAETCHGPFLVGAGSVAVLLNHRTVRRALTFHIESEAAVAIDD